MVCARCQDSNSVGLFLSIYHEARRSAQMDNPRPFVGAALICEKVLVEKDDSITLVRIADRFQYDMVGVPQGVRPLIPIQGIVRLISGPVTGEHMIKVVGENPAGGRRQLYQQALSFLGKDHTQNFIMNITLAAQDDGLHWFDILFDDELLSRIPLMIMPLSKQTPAEKNL